MAGRMQGVWEDSAASARLVAVASATVSLSTSLFGSMLGPLALLAPPCSVLTVARRGYFWTVPFSFLGQNLPFGPAWLFFALQLYIFLVHVAPRERQLGSSSFLAWLLIANTLVNVMFLSFMSVLLMLDGGYAAVPCEGLWPVIIVAMTVKSLARPEDVVSIFGFEVTSKRVPLLLTAFLTLLRGQLLWDFLAALAVGYAHERIGLDRLVQGPTFKRWMGKLAFRRIDSILGGKWLGPSDLWQTPDAESGRGGGSQGSGFHSFYRPSGANAPKVPMFTGQGQRLGSS
mmetsp:Transcript_61209/g.145740  ORF Transcript_61209/g.145740 Transcript_61209/m.145740 type:complete len:287 (-) Transcript_61209:62-922(-)